MTRLHRIAFIGNQLPRRCGIATFTHDLHQAVSTARPRLETSVVAMTDPDQTYDYPQSVRFQVREERIDDYARCRRIPERRASRCGQPSARVRDFWRRGGRQYRPAPLAPRHADRHDASHRAHESHPRTARRDAPNHRRFDEGRRHVGERSQSPAVRASGGRDKIEVIPHGIPDRPFLETHAAKAKFGFSGKTVILTFGLLSPNKGIETVIDAMPGILASCPSAVYVVLGATHPNLLRDQGEAYRESLMLRAHELGVEDHVVFINQFVDQATLLDYISMCDVYVTPYLNEAQMTSGTLAYSFGLGKAVVSTPYWHAKELLGDGRGILVPFGDSKAIGSEIAGLLADDARRHFHARTRLRGEPVDDMGADGRELSRRLREPRRRASARDVLAARFAASPGARNDRFRKSGLGHFLSLCDSTGLLQHAVYLGAGPLPRLLRRRQRPRPALLDGAAAQRRDAIVRDAHGTLCGLHSARVESGHRPLPQFHELRPPMAGTVGLGGQSRAGRFGRWPTTRARVRTRLAADGPPPLFKTALPAVRELHVSARLGVLAPGAGRLLRAISLETPSPRHLRVRAGRPIAVPARLRRNQTIGAGSRTGSPTTIRACRRR